MPEVIPTRAPEKTSRRKKLVILLSIAVVAVFALILPQTSFDLPFLKPDSNQQLLLFAALSVLIFLLFVALTFVLARNLLKLFAERRSGVIGSKFRTRLVVASLLLSFLPTIVMFWFAYGLMNRSIDRWFSDPTESLRQDAISMADLLTRYAAQNAAVEAQAIANSPEVSQALQHHDGAALQGELKRHQTTLQGGFDYVLVDGKPQASSDAPASWETFKAVISAKHGPGDGPPHFTWGKAEYILGTAAVSGREDAQIVVAIPLPDDFSAMLKRAEDSQRRYTDLKHDSRLLRRTYMDILLLLTVLVLFATTWLALFLSKLVTRPVSALAQAMQEVSRGHLDYRVEVAAADEIGDLVRSFNQMAEELGVRRTQIEGASLELEQRRRHIETILESIPTGVLSLDASRTVTHANHALLRVFGSLQDSGSPQALIGAQLGDIFPAELIEDLAPLLRRADRMGTTTTQVELTSPEKLNLAVTVATLNHEEHSLGYVLVFEDLSDLLKAQKQVAWREVARRVAHEIKNPLTPIALSADRIRRHLQREQPGDAKSTQIMLSCAETISASVDTVRALVDEFSVLARFPTARPQSADINAIVRQTLDMFDGRLDNVRVTTDLDPTLPHVMADPEGIKRALANLVDNAAEALEHSSLREVSVTTSFLANHDTIEITVSDTGYGVTPELKERLFLPYFSTKKRGTGLGLAIVSRIVEEHRGSIRIEPNQPSGSRFIIELPATLESTTIPLTAQHA